MKYFHEFIRNRLIMFLTCVLLLNGYFVSINFNHSITWLGTVSGVVLFSIFEYVVHRYLLHRFPKLLPKAYIGHLAHHQHPADMKYLFGPIRYDLFSYVTLYTVLFAATRSFRLTSAVVFGVSLCQMYYQWKHFVSHRPIIPITPWGKWMKKSHLLHHYKDAECWFGVSNPVMDILMGTDSKKHYKKTKATGFKSGKNKSIHRDI